MRGFFQFFCKSHFGIAAEQIIQFHDGQHSLDVHQLGLIVYYSFYHLKDSWHHWNPFMQLPWSGKHGLRQVSEP